MSDIWFQIASGFGGIILGVLIWLAVDADLRDAIRMWVRGDL